ncbi:sigma-70 family RNA polymerase sigma factor [Staphylococcus sp. GSSP0090]|nr:sigma-70 family RNA polymerase sigma factor [Staphylococcus sp. GSSP0090]
MHFSKIYDKTKHIIYVLLKKYNIKYNNDEFIQLLTIKLWELSQKYNAQKSTSFQSYLYTRLNFYLIDLFRKQHSIYELLAPLDEIKCHQVPTTYFDANITYDNFFTKLSTQEQQWLRLKLYGYKQKEIAHHLNCSISTVKNIQQRVQVKYVKYYKL